MPDGYQLRVGELRKHLTSIDESFAKLREALDAAQQVSLPTEAFGKICQFLPPKLDPVESEGINALRAAVDGMRDAKEALGDTGKSYESDQESTAKGFRDGAR